MQHGFGSMALWEEEEEEEEIVIKTAPVNVTLLTMQIEKNRFFFHVIVKARGLD